jgi:competence protein ComEA
MAGTNTALSKNSSSQTTSPATKATSQVDVNNASLKTLETLPGVSPALAKKIVSGRPYSNLSDLAHVNGMGQKKANALKHHVTFGPEGGAATTKSTKSTKKTHHAKASSSSAGSSTTPSPTEMSPSPEPSASSTEPSASASHLAPTEESSSSEPSASSSQLAPGQTVDINTASTEELDKLPGIGPSKAQAIVDYRNQHGDFKSVEDIKNVHGIKEGTFSKIKDYITVGQ